jgi:DNA-binding PadR family transcriptional regulator
LLGFLYASPSHGYVLHGKLSREFGNIWHASQSQTYSILKRLEAQGYVSSTNVEQSKHPGRQLLQITDPGRTRFITWLMQPTKSSVHAIRVEFVTRLYFLSKYYPDKTQELIRVQIDTVNIGLIALHEDMAKLLDSEIFERLALDLRIKLLNSSIIWLEECQVSLASKQPTGVRRE